MLANACQSLRKKQSCKNVTAEIRNGEVSFGTIECSFNLYDFLPHMGDNHLVETKNNATTAAGGIALQNQPKKILTCNFIL